MGLSFSLWCRVLYCAVRPSRERTDARRSTRFDRSVELRRLSTSSALPAIHVEVLQL